MGFLFSFRPYKKWGDLFDRFVRCKKDTGLWAVPTDIGHYFGHIMPKEVYYPPIKGPFEDFSINLPHDPDTYLKNQYGDYWVIPPEADREKHYSVASVWTAPPRNRKRTEHRTNEYDGASH